MKHVEKSRVQSVERAFALLEAMNRRASTSVAQLHRDSGIPKPTIVRMLNSLITLGYVVKDQRQSGYLVTSRVKSLSAGYHGDPVVVEAARPWAISLTRRIQWPVGVAILDGDEAVIRFSTISDSAISPFHATLNMRLNLYANALGLAYYAFCPEAEREMLDAMIGERGSQLLANREDGWLDWRVRTARARGYADRDPGVEPRDSGTVAVPIYGQDRVLASIGITYFRRGVTEGGLQEYVQALKHVSSEISRQIVTLDQVDE